MSMVADGDELFGNPRADIAMTQHHKIVGRRHGKRAQQTASTTANKAVLAPMPSISEHRRGGKRRLATKQPKRVAEIACKHANQFLVRMAGDDVGCRA